MFYKSKGKKGNILISKSVFLRIIKEIINKYDGNVLFSSNVNKNKLLNNIFTNKKDEPKSLEISLDKDSKLIVDLNVMLKFGASIKNTCLEITESIKKEIEEKTGVVVSKVNISVDGMFALRKRIPNNK